VSSWIATPFLGGFEMLFNKTGVLEMKKIALVGATLALVMAAGTASAANSMSVGTLGLNVPVITSTPDVTVVPTPLISGKYFFAKEMAILGGVGFNSGGPSGTTVTTFSVLGGVRKYLNTNDFAPFVDGVLEYTSASGTPSSSKMSLVAEAGAEYFLAKQFSVEGKAGFGYLSNDPGAPGVKTSYFGTTTANLSVNFYF
jgi:hypothetical protein